ncbi:hypothetical protein [Actinomadura sp. NEAU-AAG7]|uniref:hypothetical protein n=1 Tax=Actinomadura sp. NEAU-AAG7 TaxID=2839640 RepID=UPI001BE441F9|nr:hypothetical protein [Actinomadura sp. NEAU-AAG7]MBT2209632.1 hypothetical protein [Actinomadura sp. NEAU-AAG7]
MDTSTRGLPVLFGSAVAVVVASGVGAPPSDPAARSAPVANRTPRQAVGGTMEETALRDGPRMIEPRPASPSRAPRRRAAGPLHRLTVSVLDRAGEAPADGDAESFGVFDPSTGEQVHGTFTGGSGQVEVPPGTYRVGTWIRTREPGRPDAAALVIRPSVTVAGDTGVLLDARTTRKVEVSLDDPGPKMFLGDVLVPMTTKGERHAYRLPLENGLYVSPAVGVSLHVFTTWTPGGTGEGRYQYSVLTTSKGRIPDEPVFRVHRSDLAAVRTGYPAPGRAACVSTWTGPDLPDLPVIVSHGLLAGTAPGEHTVHTTPGVRWSDDLLMDGDDCAFQNLEATQSGERYPSAGEYTRRWNTAPLTPALAYWNGGDLTPAVVRRQDQLDVNMSLFSDGVPNHVGPRDAPWEDGHITGSTTLKLDGRPIGTSQDAGFGTFTLPGGGGRYRLETTAERNVPWSPLGTRTDAAWTFTSAHTGTEAAPPLMAVRYDAGLDGHSRALAGAAHRVGAKVQTPPGAGAPRVKRLRVRVSYDDGRTWRDAATRPAGDGWAIDLRHPADAEYVSLSATAVDAAGGTVEQSTIRAYALRR